MIRPRRPNKSKETTPLQASSHPSREVNPPAMASTTDDESRSLLVPEPLRKSTAWTSQNRWIVLALASGACAAFNGVFAKLTTTELTSSFASRIASIVGIDAYKGALEAVLRCVFFGLNLVFNGVMWTLFTAALARGHSTTQVSIINTSANFVITALLGLAIFSESLPPLWWLGAAMLVAGNVIVGRKDEGVKSEDAAGDAAVADGGYAPLSQQPGIVPAVIADEVRRGDEDVVDLGDME